MKTILIPLSLFLCYACSTPEQQQEAQAPAQDSHAKEFTTHPKALQQILNTHGGLDVWRNKKSMSFEMVKEEGNEQHYVQLQDRRDRVEGPNFTMGYDGLEVWVEADTSYKGDPEFYHNLMFYFYAMPFVLADDGIQYEDAEPLEMDGIVYPGIRISYEEGVGFSSKDEYVLYYQPDTFEMAWLGYTVTYFSDEPSEDLHWIKYSAWQQVDGLLLPKDLTWYQYENGLPTEPRGTREFRNVELGEQPHPDDLFIGP